MGVFTRLELVECTEAPALISTEETNVVLHSDSSHMYDWSIV